MLEPVGKDHPVPEDTLAWIKLRAPVLQINHGFWEQRHLVGADGRLTQDFPAARLPLEFEKVMKMNILELKKEAKKAKQGGRF